ncbi:MAG: nucleotidyltransferase domain-containing protein [Candidatus Magnetomorum sp.]|nr:nucleotidyltransferase domain-containing protein [Candidatus Magnetomorum sp.]
MKSSPLRTFDYEALKQKLTDHQKVDFAFVFGSAKLGRLHRSDSDIDIAMWLTPPASFDDQLELLGLCQNVLQYDHIDFVLLNKASVLLRFEVLSGIPLVIKDMNFYASFFSETCRYYEDQMLLFKKNKEIMRFYKNQAKTLKNNI